MGDPKVAQKEPTNLEFLILRYIVTETNQSAERTGCPARKCCCLGCVSRVKQSEVEQRKQKNVPVKIALAAEAFSATALNNLAAAEKPFQLPVFHRVRQLVAVSRLQPFGHLS